jgi:hypothetical protein
MINSASALSFQSGDDESTTMDMDTTTRLVMRMTPADKPAPVSDTFQRLNGDKQRLVKLQQQRQNGNTERPMLIQVRLPPGTSGGGGRLASLSRMHVRNVAGVPPAPAYRKLSEQQSARAPVRQRRLSGDLARRQVNDSHVCHSLAVR